MTGLHKHPLRSNNLHNRYTSNSPVESSTTRSSSNNSHFQRNSTTTAATTAITSTTATSTAAPAKATFLSPAPLAQKIAIPTVNNSSHQTGASGESGSGNAGQPRTSYAALQHLASGGAAVGPTTRERTAQCVDYYNSQVLRARLQAGLTTLASDRNHNIPSYPNERNSIPASSNERTNNSIGNNDRNGEGERNSGRTIPHQHNNNSFHHHVRRQLYQPHANHQDVLYRSTSSLELQEHIYLQHNHHHHHYHNPVTTTNTPVLRREYGSHGSINVVGTEPRPSPVVGTSESFFAMLQDYRPATLIGVDQRSPGPTEYLRVNAEQPPASLTSVSNIQQTDEVQTEQNITPRPASPKLKHKIQRLLGHNSNNSTSGKGLKSCASIQSDDGPSPSTPGTSPDIEERQRRRCFAHYDCQSMTTNLSYAARLREQLLARRRNTTTGASAASMPNTRSSTPDGDCEIDNDTGDGISNDLVETCPFFRNEIGGEEERTISLTARQQQNRNCSAAGRPMHQPALAYGFALLDYSPGDTHWKRSTCPYQKLPRPIECVDQGALYYRTHFMGNEHQNYFGTDDQLGPVAISVRRERIAEEEKNGNGYHQYRIIIRTSELLTLRGTVLEESIPHLRVSSSGKIQSGAKEVLEYIAPEVQLSCLRLGVSSHHVEQLIATVDEQGLASQYKVGIMYCRAGQSTEEEMYNNENAGPAFIEFLGCLGKTVRLLGFPKYRAGLDNKSDSTGLYSVYAEHKNNEIMFHVSTMLPYSPNNRQQLLRKRHIGNDIVTIVFQEPGALPFTPKTIRSQFQHVFIVVKAINPCTENTHYQVAVTRSKDVPIFGPPIKEGAVYPKSKTFADFLLAKIINAENAAHQSEKFATMARRTRLEYIKDLINNHSTNIGIESGQKFTFFNKPKKEKSKPLQINHKRLTGAMCWQVLVDDNGLGQRIEAFLGISTDSIVLIEESSRQIIFVAPCTSILGYTAQTNSLKIYHHQGENFTIHIRETYSDRDELMEIVDRLKVLTPASVTQEMILRRDSSGNLGFHVQPDGLVTYVEPGSKAELSGLTKGARLVEVCKIALSTLSHEAMIDFLKTSETVTISMIPPVVEGEMRKGCPLQNCRYIVGLMESDYENLNNEDNSRSSNRSNAQSQHPVSNNHRRRYERSFSPPRSSSSSSGYGTGSSSKSFLGQDHRFPVNPEGTMTSSSSGHSSDDRWYELLETQEPETVLQGSAARVVISTPPPIPVRSTAVTTNEVTPLQQSSSEISSSMQHLSTSSNHHEFHQQPHNHNRIQVSHSLPLPHANFSLPLNSSNMTLGIPRDERKMKQSNGRDDYSSLADVRLQQQLMDNHEANEKLMNINIEDEIPSSGHSSPRRINKHRANTSNNNSRNQSPRPTQTETRLRPGVISRSNRNSANLSTSTLQEDLMKLINPDYMHEEDFQQSSNVIRQKSQIRENRTDQAEVIFTTARPATVISNASTASSPAPSDFKSCKEERISPRVSGNNNIPGNSVAPEPLPLPDEELDWSSLVDTATRAMQQVPKEIDGSGRSRFEYNERWLDEIELKDNATVTASASVPELQSHVSELESRVTLEQRRRKSLEEEIKRLREENRRLQDESQAAAHQLRRFTEWFFQTIDKQHDKQ